MAIATTDLETLDKRNHLLAGVSLVGGSERAGRTGSVGKSPGHMAALPVVNVALSNDYSRSLGLKSLKTGYQELSVWMNRRMRTRMSGGARGGRLPRPPTRFRQHRYRQVIVPRRSIERHFAWRKRYFGLKGVEQFTLLRVMQFALGAARYQHPDLLHGRSKVIAHL
jgi:hypothetical protein